MNYVANRVAILIAASIGSAWAYMPNPFDGPALHRTDYTNIQFLANQNIAAGMMTSDGKVWITADSAPMDAINSAIAAWNGIASLSVHFAPVQTTSLSYDALDGNHVITFIDDAYSLLFASGIVAITAVEQHTDGTILDTDILFSPFVQFSTTHAAGTYDLQSVLTHEIGHSLGANHTNILSATMFYAATLQDTHAQSLSPDDIAFVSALYPAAGVNAYGTISGNATVSGAPLLGGAITAVDPTTGITVGGLSSIKDGSFSFQAPPGNYLVYVEPAVNLNLYRLTRPLSCLRPLRRRSQAVTTSLPRSASQRARRRPSLSPRTRGRRR